MKDKYIWKEIKNSYFDESSSIHIKNLNYLLEKAYDLKFKKDYKTLEKVLDDSNISLLALKEINDKIINSEKVLSEKELINYDSELVTLLKNQRKELSSKYVCAVDYINSKKEIEFNRLLNELKKNRNNLVIIKDLRTELDSLDYFFYTDKNKGLYLIMEQLHNFSIPSQIKDYNINRKKRPSLDREVDLIIKRYTHIAESENKSKDGKSLILETNYKTIKSDLVKQLLDSQYYERFLILKKINDNLTGEEQRLLELKRRNNLIEKEQEYLKTIEKDDSLACFSSLPLYVTSLGFPENYDYYRLRRILVGENGEANWTKRFDNFFNELNNIIIANQLDYEYLQKIRYGIKNAIEKPGMYFDIKTAKKTYLELNNVLNEHSKSLLQTIKV